MVHFSVESEDLVNTATLYNNMPETQITIEAEGRITKFTLREAGQPLSYRVVVQRWQLSEDFRAFFINLLAKSPYTAFRWEVPVVTAATAQRSFEFVLLDYPRLERQFDDSTFGKYFGDGDVVTFPSLRGEAQLVAPCPRCDQTDRSVYSHLASFVRRAPPSQVHAFWQAVGKVVDERLADRRSLEHRVWLSTAGLGVAWLHARLDSHPKYYAYMPYKTQTG